MEVHTTQGAHTRKLGLRRAKTALGRPTHADRPRPFLLHLVLPFDLVPPQAISSSEAKSHGEIHSSSIATRTRTEGYWIVTGALVAFIYFRGFYTMINTTMCNIMG
jgi:hypothetical protein